MANMQENKGQIGSSHIKKALSVFFFLLTLLFLFSPGTHLKGLSLVLVYPFGVVGFYGIVLLCLFLSLRPLFYPNLRLSWRIYAAYGILLFGLGLIFSCALGGESLSYHSLSGYTELVKSDFAGFGFYSDFSLGLGMVGAFLGGLFVEPGLSFLGYCLGAIALAVSAFLLLFPLIAYWAEGSRQRKAIAASRAEMGELPEKAEREPYIAPEDIDDSFSYDTKVDNPLSGFRFEPAGEASLPLRRGSVNSLGRLADVGPQEVPTISPEYVKKGPARLSGLQEAHFTPTHVSEPAVHLVVEPEPEEAPEERVDNPLRRNTAEFPRRPQPSPSPDLGIAAPPVLSPSKPSFAPAEPVRDPLPSVMNDQPAKRLAEPTFLTQEDRPEPIIEEVSFPKQEDFAPDLSLEKAIEPALAPSPAPSPSPAPMPVNAQSAPANGDDEESLFEPETPWPPYSLPPESLLKEYGNDPEREAELENECEQRTEIINQTFLDLGAGAKVVGHKIGPSVTRFDVATDRDVSVSSLSKYMNDVALRLGGVSVRFSEIVPGKITSGLEVINSTSRIVSFKEVNERLPKKDKGIIVPFGEDIDGKVLGADLTSFPHMLVAGTTGSGKSVFISSMIMAILMRYRPEQVRFVLIDPKTVSFSKIADIPHLLCPILKEPAQARNALKKLCDLMDRRYKVFEKAMVNDIDEFNRDYCEYAHVAKMPYIVVIIDEYADLNEQCKDVSSYVLRLAQKARACGIHLIVATQRPDVKVITGTIKANLPVHVALMVANTIDSQTILGCAGAEELAPHGDMLVDCPQVLRKQLARCQGCMVDPGEMRAVAGWVKQQQAQHFDPEFLNLDDDEAVEEEAAAQAMPSAADLKAASDEEKYQMIKTAIMAREYCSISQIQRDFSVGFTRGGKIMRRLQQEGIVAADGANPNSTKGNKVLVHSVEGEG